MNNQINKSSKTLGLDEEIKNYVYNPVPKTNDIDIGRTEDNSYNNEDDSESITLAELEELEDAKIPFFSRALPKLGITAAIFTPIFFVAWGFINGFQNPKTAVNNSTDVTSESEDLSRLEAENQALTEQIDELQILNGTMAQKFEDLQNQRTKSITSKTSTKPKPPSKAKKTVTPKPTPPTKTRVVKVRQPPKEVEPQVTKQENDWERWQKISNAMVYGGFDKNSSQPSQKQANYNSNSPNTGKSEVTLASLELNSVIDSSNNDSSNVNNLEYEASEYAPVPNWEKPLLSEQPHQLIEAGTNLKAITLSPLVSTNNSSSSILTVSLQEPLVGSRHEILPAGTQLKLEVNVDNSDIVTITNLNAYDPLGTTIALPIDTQSLTLVGRDGLPLIAKSLDREPNRREKVERNQILIDVLTRSSRAVRNNEAAYTGAELLADKLDRQNQALSNNLDGRQNVLFIPAGTELNIFINQPTILPIEKQSLFENSDSNIPDSKLETGREPIDSTSNEIVEVVDYSEPTTDVDLESEASQPDSINQPVFSPLTLIEEQSFYDERDQINTFLEANKASKQTSKDTSSMFWLQNPLS